MDLAGYTVETLLKELNLRGHYGAVSLQVKGSGRLEMWWGDRVKCLGLASRLSTSINADIDNLENSEEGDDESDEEDEGGGLDVDFPQMGQYL